MRLPVRFATLVAVSVLGGGVLAASRPQPLVPGMPTPDTGPRSFAGAADEGYPIENETLITRCSRCHEPDDQGRMTRISYERKTPEGWQTSIRRMMALNNVSIEPDEAREIVRYLSNRQGLAPEELEPGRFEVERRMIKHRYEADAGVEETCIQCHSMGRVITQRRTRDEWDLLMATHRGLYPLVDFQAFRTGGRTPDSDEDPRQPMDLAVDHLAEAFPLETPEWSAWSATMRPPRIAGTWLLEGHEPGKGPVFGSVEISAGATPDEFTTRASLTYVEGGLTMSRTGTAIVYTGYQWRGRSNAGEADELREVMTVERGWRKMTGRWYQGAYEEFGPDVTLTRVGSEPVIAGVYPRALGVGAGPTQIRVHGANLPSDVATAAFDFGPGVVVLSATASSSNLFTLRLTVDADAALGARDLYVDGVSLTEAIVVHDGVDRLDVTPEAGMARIGGANFPKGYQPFDAIGWNDGPDGEPDTADDLELGRVSVAWSVEEYTATYEDDDVSFIGQLGQDGVFVPAVDGPNPDRPGSRNNIGDVWVVATYTGPGADPDDPIQARSNLIVTVPLYMKFDPFDGIAPGRLVP